MTRSFLVAGARTPIGRFQGGLAPLRAVELGAAAIRAAIARAGVSPDAVEYTVMGHVLQAGQGQITARQAAIGAGIPQHVPALTVNKVCLSGTTAIALADQMIRAGELEIAVAGGMESMTNAPYVLPTAREGSRLGNAPMIDVMIHDGLWCAFEDRHMGAATDAMNVELGVTREDQDRWAVRSQARAAAAWAEGRMDAEVEPVQVPQRRGEPVVVGHDEVIRAEDDPREAGRPRAGVHPGRHGHRRQRLADQRRGVRGRGGERGGGAPARAGAARGDRRLRHGRGPLRRAAHRAGARDGEGAEARGTRRRRPRPRRDQRGVRGGPVPRLADARSGRGDRERERRRDRARPSDRCERRADRAHARARDAAPEREPGRPRHRAVAAARATR